MYLGAIIVFPLCSWKPRQARFFPIYGLIPIVLGIVASSFATKVSHLILTQGVIYGFGGLFLYYPIYVFIDEWFVRRKGFAFGIMWAGSGCGGLSGPLVLNWGLSKYGPAVFLRGWALAMVCYSFSPFPLLLQSLSPSRLTPIYSSSRLAHSCISSNPESPHHVLNPHPPPPSPTPESLYATTSLPIASSANRPTSPSASAIFSKASATSSQPSTSRPSPNARCSSTPKKLIP